MRRVWMLASVVAALGCCVGPAYEAGNPSSEPQGIPDQMAGAPGGDSVPSQPEPNLAAMAASNAAAASAMAAGDNVGAAEAGSAAGFAAMGDSQAAMAADDAAAASAMEAGDDLGAAEASNAAGFAAMGTP